jgi:SRSO17 transposase
MLVRQRYKSSSGAICLADDCVQIDILERVMTGEQIASLVPALGAHLGRFRHCFKRDPTFEHLGRYVAGLLAELSRKSVEPIALAAQVPPRTLQEFLSHLSWDHGRAEATLHRLVADRAVAGQAIAVVDSSGYPKRGDKTPGVQRQWCGQTGKVDNCVVAQHLVWTDNDPRNPFACALCSDLFLPEGWADDKERCREAHVPDTLTYRPKWRIAIEQLERAICRGVRIDWVTFDEEYGRTPAFWFELDRLGRCAVGEVNANFHCWPTPPACRSLQKAHASKQVDNVCRYSPLFTRQDWRRLEVKDATRGPVVWHVKAARVHLVEHDRRTRHSEPTDRQYWLIVAKSDDGSEIKYFVSNAPASTPLDEMMRVGFSRWHVEKWLERAKQEAGMGAFEVRTYRSLIRHWVCAMIAMHFLAEQTTRLRGEKSEDHPRAGRPRHERAGRPASERATPVLA